ncbi:phasin family protein [Sphingobium algorifonticola]|uniref:Phasin family protein n=1 Tax=Sphingobium algorifonticola TaxID=2008318 RepID=A0A437JBD0_9SPHN|nr:phasin family protein [Sphingobium algorifonticola]RVT43226.1 phasin family protein [Sphingobium algorifonticola]
MADTPKKMATPRKAPVSGGKGVALTAREALKAADLATTKPAPKPKAAVERKAPAKAAPVAAAPEKKATTAKPVVAEPARVAPPITVAEPEVVKKPEPVVVQEPVIETVHQTEEAEVVTSPLNETMPQVDDTIKVAIAEGKTTMNDVIENTKKYTEEAKTRFQSAFAEMNEKAKVSVEKSTKTMEEMTELAKGNVEAMVESGKIAAKGMEAMGQEAAEYSRLTFEKASAMMKSLAAVKSPTEFFQLQTEMLSSAFDAFAKESAKNSEAMIKLAGDVAQPLSSRMSVMSEKVKSLAA